MKKKAAAEIGFHSVDVTLPDTATTEELLAAVRELNADPKIHGILVQLPLPDQCDEPLILKEIAVEKDADGFSAMNIGNLCLKGGDPPLAVPCTPAGCIELLQRSGYSNLSGLNAVVIGRSNIDGWAPRPPTRAQHAAARARLVTPARAAFAGSRWRCC